MADQSDLDKKYFVDNSRYNCPYCNRRHVVYSVVAESKFDWNDNKACYVLYVRCGSCRKTSMHLSFQDLTEFQHSAGSRYLRFKAGIDIDPKLFYSQPTSFFVMDENIPRVIRDLITEAEGCLKMNFLTGASACARKAIYELLVKEEITFEDEDGKDISYADRIKALKEKYQGIDPTYFDDLGAIQEMTSDKVHEQSWDEWDSENLRLILGMLKAVLHEMYVEPAKRKARSKEIQQLREKARGKVSMQEVKEEVDALGAKIAEDEQVGES